MGRSVWALYKFMSGLNVLDSHENVENDEQCGRRATSKNKNNVELVHVVLENDWITICKLSEDLNVSFGLAHSVLVMNWEWYVSS